MTERIVKTEAFLREKLKESPYFAEHPEAGAYRLEHSIRVARIGAEIARNEGMDEEHMTIACLLHDVGYGTDFPTDYNWNDHGRHGAQIARPFLSTLGLDSQTVEDICYGIAIHVDDKADFPGERTPFCETIGDADNIDRFDAYRIYETLQYMEFSKMKLSQKKEVVTATLEKMQRLKQLKLATPTANRLWQQRLSDYAAFYEKLQAQLDNSSAIQK